MWTGFSVLLIYCYGKWFSNRNQNKRQPIKQQVKVDTKIVFIKKRIDDEISPFEKIKKKTKKRKPIKKVNDNQNVYPILMPMRCVLKRENPCSVF